MGEWMDEGVNGSEHNHLSIMIGCNVIREKKMKLYPWSQICIRRIQHEAATCLLKAVSSGFSLPGLSGLGQKKNLAVEISLCVDVRFANQLPPTIDLRRITMCFGFHARFVSVGSKVGCTAIMCNCDVALSVLRNRFISMRSIEFDWSIEVRLLIWSIKFRSSDLIDWAIANVWCVIVHQSHF